MITIEIQPKCCAACGQPKRAPIGEIEREVGTARLYIKGTGDGWYVDCRDRAQADLLVVNLNLIPDIKARICGG